MLITSAILITTLCAGGLSAAGMAPLDPTKHPPYPPRGGIYRFELETPGGPLPFIFEDIASRGLPYVSKGPNLFGLTGYIVNGPEDIITGWGPVQNESGMGYPSLMRFPDYDAHITTDVTFEGTVSGTYFKVRGDAVASVPVLVTQVDSRQDRFDREHPADPDAITTINGRWKVKFDSSNDPALGVFEVTEEGIATGTFLTNTGDYRYLEGLVDGRTLKLSCFDGGHAFLFHATLQDDGGLKGDFWSGDWWHEAWTATPAPEGFTLSDGFDLTRWTGDAGLKDLVFMGLDGTETSVADVIEARGGGPAIIEVFGSWCPNCHDAASAVKRLKETHGITVVGLAFELTEDFDRSKRQIQTFMRWHGADWPVLIAGTAGKEGASEKLPVFDKLRAYPTTVFVNADGSIAAVHTGFTGPAAPEEHEALMKEWDAIVRGMLAGE